MKELEVNVKEEGEGVSKRKEIRVLSGDIIGRGDCVYVQRPGTISIECPFFKSFGGEEYMITNLRRLKALLNAIPEL